MSMEGRGGRVWTQCLGVGVGNKGITQPKKTCVTERFARGVHVHCIGLRMKTDSDVCVSYIIRMTLRSNQAKLMMQQAE
jgi:hypothetical protein